MHLPYPNSKSNPPEASKRTCWPPAACHREASRTHDTSGRRCGCGHLLLSPDSQCGCAWAERSTRRHLDRRRSGWKFAVGSSETAISRRDQQSLGPADRNMNDVSLSDSGLATRRAARVKNRVVSQTPASQRGERHGSKALSTGGGRSHLSSKISRGLSRGARRHTSARMPRGGKSTQSVHEMENSKCSYPTRSTQRVCVLIRL